MLSFKEISSKIKNFLQKVGPGIVTGASDDDPSGIATYSQAGASFGLQTLWVTMVTFPLMIAVQEMCARIGLVSKRGIGAILKEYYPKWLLWFVAILTVPAAIVNIGADLAGMGAVMNLLIPTIPVPYFTIFSALLILSGIIGFSYKRLESVMKWLTLVLGVYLIVPFFAVSDWKEVLTSTFTIHFSWDKGFIAMLVAILGTTISPYLFFWEAAMEVEDANMPDSPDVVSVPPKQAKKIMSQMRLDNFVGMFFSQLVMYFIILTAGSTLFKNGINDIATVEQAAQALQPIAGDFAYVLFTVGVIGTGFLAIPVLAGSCAYLLSELLGWQEGINKKVSQAKGFYLVIVLSVLCGLAINFFGVNPIQALVFTAVLYGLVSPVLIFIIILIANNKEVMKNFTNSIRSNIFGGLAVVIMTLAALSFLWSFL